MQHLMEERAEPAVATPPVTSGSVPATFSTRPKFPADTGFQAEVRRRVARYFQETGKRERDLPAMYLKTAIIFVWLTGSWALLVFAAQSWWQALPLAVILALAMAALGFSIQHDGGHNAYSRRRWVNKLAAGTLDLMGASSYLWRWKHSIIHHTYTNVTGVDTDVEIGAIVRVTPHQKRWWFHRWQQFYLWMLYGLTASRWHLYGDFKEVITGWMGPHRIPRPRGRELAVFVGGKVFSYGWLLIVPMFFHPIWLVVCYYAIVTGVMGVAMSIVFQLAHCVGEADFPMPDPTTARLGDSWAVHQVETTVDFARGNWPLSWWLGGLNFQIEHHLFPRVCHIHYPAISRIVEETCREYGVRYQVHHTFGDGLVSHYRWLREMGRPDAGTTSTVPA
jgi:linoleoyl-CoA desaturase